MVQTDTLKSRVINFEQELLQLEPQWNELWKISKESSFSQSFRSCQLCWQHLIKPNGGHLFIIVVENGNSALLIWPLAVHKKGISSILKPIGPSAGEVSGLLICPQSDILSLLAIAWKKIYQSKTDLLSLPFVKKDSDLYSSIKGNYDPVPDVVPYATICDQADWDGFSKLVGLNAKEQLNRKKRRLSETGEVTFGKIDPIENPDAASSLIDWMLENKRAWAQKTGKKGGWLYSVNYRKYLIDLVSTINPVQAFRVFALYVNNEPIAVKILCFDSHKADLLIASYAPSFSKYSPGLILDEHWMQYIFEKRLDVDFGVGAEPYKLYWSLGNLYVVDSFHIPLSTVGSLLHQGKKIITAIKKIKCIPSLAN